MSRSQYFFLQKARKKAHAKRNENITTKCVCVLLRARQCSCIGYWAMQQSLSVRQFFHLAFLVKSMQRNATQRTSTFSISRKKHALSNFANSLVVHSQKLVPRPPLHTPLRIQRSVNPLSLPPPSPTSLSLVCKSLFPWETECVWKKE